MNWDDCRYCNGGRMVPVGKVRVAPYDSQIIEIAHRCDSCQRHNDTFLWVPKTKAIPTPRDAIYGDYIPDLEYRDPYMADDQLWIDRKSQPEVIDTSVGENIVFFLVVLVFLLAGLSGWLAS
jgi:hypothetical protein